MAKVRRGSWTEVEDRIIARAVEEGVLKWSEIGKRLPSQKTGKQCRERWFNHLDPTLKKSPWTTEEDAALVDAQNELGNSWTRIAHELDGRSENEVKNRWYSAPMRKLVKSKKGKRPHEGEGKR
ncbi:Homeodomain-like protein, partial [Ochromonadaceae sp. CCMP2298]